jgi:hypothetical protein
MSDDQRPLTDEELAQKVARARSKSFLGSLGFAMAQESFNEEECWVYMDLAFESRDVTAYAVCTSWLTQHGFLPPQRVLSLFNKALFAQHAEFLAHLGQAVPYLAKDPNLSENWRSGLMMAMLSGDTDTARGLARIVLSYPQGESMLVSSFKAIKNLSNQSMSGLWLEADIEHCQKNLPKIAGLLEALSIECRLSEPTQKALKKWI